jgi:hypothetical protein
VRVNHVIKLLAVADGLRVEQGIGAHAVAFDGATKLAIPLFCGLSIGVVLKSGDLAGSTGIAAM